uniref:Thioesterase domain-containing protein n=1 Tax=Arundo donax TaxID=35708 RepID=A0A0A9FB37_ARUDO
MDDGQQSSSGGARPSSSSNNNSNSSGSMTAELDPVLHSIGFEIGEVSPSQLTGRLPVTAKCCQPFQVLHGGVSAMVSEALASMGAHMASGYRRVAGVSLNINHFRSAAVGDVVLARAAPVHVGRSTQVWEVKLWKQDPSTQGKGPQISESRVTLLCNLPVPDNLKHAGDALKKYAQAGRTTTSRL